MSEALLTIVIPTRDRPDLLALCLRSVFEEQRRPPRVIVSDNSIHDHPAIQSLRSQYGFAYIRQSGRVPIVEHQNACLGMPTTRWVLLLHDDDEVCSGSLDTLQEYLVNGPEAGIVMAGTQAIDLDGRVTSQWLPPRRATFKGDDALLALGLDWGLRAPGTVYGVQESRRLGGLPEILGLPGDYAHAMALAYHFGIAFHPGHVGRQREGHQRTTVFDTPDKALRWLSFTCQQAAAVRTFGGSPDIADRLVDYLAWSTFEALESSWRAFDRCPVFRLLATALPYSPHPGAFQAKVRRLYPALFWRRQPLAWLLFKLARAAKPATLRRYLPSPLRRSLRRLAQPATPILGEVRFALHVLPVRLRSRHLSAMMRVKNEDQFLYASVKSIVDHVDEVVLIDNLSTDRTSHIITALREEHPTKVLSFSYPFEVRRAGRETAELASLPGGRSSPHLLANYYNWCLRRCTKPFVLKWDADMLATDALYATLGDWRRSNWLTVFLVGANVHPNLTHLIADNPRDRGYTTQSALTYPGCWLFPRWRTRFDTNRSCEYVAGPFLDGREASRYRHYVDEVAFLHLKLCELAPFSNVSPADLMASGVSGSGLSLGIPLTGEWREVLRRWLLDPRQQLPDDRAVASGHRRCIPQTPTDT